MQPSESLVGRQFDRYRLTELIGESARAVVYRADVQGESRPVAVKTVQGTPADIATACDRFRYERELVSGLSHPNILKPLDMGCLPDLTYQVTPFAEQGSLRKLIHENNPLPLVTISRVLNDLAAAFDYLHAQGIVHCDLKPQNVLLSAEQVAQLADFDIARRLDDPQPMRAGIGTPLYMAPEQWIGSKISPRTDVYSLGVVLFEMLCGLPPFRAESPEKMKDLHLREVPPPLRLFRPGLPPNVQDIFVHALAKFPLDRYDSAGKLAQVFADAIRPE